MVDQTGKKIYGQIKKKNKWYAAMNCSALCIDLAAIISATFTAYPQRFLC